MNRQRFFTCACLFLLTAAGFGCKVLSADEPVTATDEVSRGEKPADAGRKAESLLQWAEYDPVAAVVSRIHAQAEMMNAQRRNVRALGLSNRANMTRLKVDAMEVEIEEHDTRQIRNLRRLSNKAWANHRTWMQLKDNPDLTEGSIRSGRALNFLLTRLAVSALPYRFDPNDTRYESGVLSELRLEPDVFENLTLQQQRVTFPADSLKTGAISYWPYLLRWEEFAKPRAAYEEARARVVAEAIDDGEASVGSLMKMQQALERFTSAFRKSSKARSWAIAHGRHMQYGQCDEFFYDLEAEMKRTEATGDLRPFKSRDTYDPSEDNDHIVNFLSFMNRNNIKFTRARPGSESAHQKLFTLMRDLYLTVEDADESTRPQTLRDRAKEAMNKDRQTSPRKERLTAPADQ